MQRVGHEYAAYPFAYVQQWRICLCLHAHLLTPFLTSGQYFCWNVVLTVHYFTLLFYILYLCGDIALVSSLVVLGWASCCRCESQSFICTEIPTTTAVNRLCGIIWGPTHFPLIIASKCSKSRLAAWIMMYFRVWEVRCVSGAEANQDPPAAFYPVNQRPAAFWCLKIKVSLRNILKFTTVTVYLQGLVQIKHLDTPSSSRYWLMAAAETSEDGFRVCVRAYGCVCVCKKHHSSQ